jgi:hypothetical protein
MNYFKVRIYLKGELIFEKIVKSKVHRTAITNVITNIYRGDMDTATVEKLEVKGVETNYVL